jgi:DNA-binding transcriptional regulator YdaS (Cro superfamily)
MTLASHMAKSGLTDRTLAAALGVSDELVRLWRNGHRRIPAERVLAIEKITKISRHVLRPDIYPREPPPEAKRTKRATAELAE